MFRLTVVLFAQLASSVLASQEDDDDEVEDGDEGETTLYFDAEEGTFVNEAGEEIRVDIEGEEDEELEDDDDDEDEDEDGEEANGGETPAATANEPATTGTRTLRGRSMLLLRRNLMVRC